MADWRRVTVAPGHVVLARPAKQATSRPGFIRITNRRRGDIEVPVDAWASAEAHTA